VFQYHHKTNDRNVSMATAFQQKKLRIHGLEQGFPNWGTCTPRGTFAYLKGYI